MRIGLPKEIKDGENRVGLTPGAVKALTRRGHQVLVETGAGMGSFLNDEEYRTAGAEIVPMAADAWAVEMVVKVKEPIPSEVHFLRPDQMLFTYLHLAADRQLTDALLASGVTAIAYETVQTGEGKLPLLMPMSEVAGRMATQVGASYLERHHGGRGVLLGGVPGVAPANVAILGGGTVGTNAAKVALGMGAQVTVLDVNHDRLQYLDDIFQGRLQTRTSNEYSIEQAVFNADLVIGAVLIPGGRAPLVGDACRCCRICARVRSLSMSRWIREAASRQHVSPHTATPSMSSMAWCIMGWQICQERCRVPAPLP